MVKNYTSTVPANRSVQHIEDRLVKHNAKNILKLYEDQCLVGVAFIIPNNGKDIPFKLPARIDRVEARLRSVIKRPRKGTLGKLKEQAARTAWKLLADWVDIQLSLVELDQVEMLEIFMPYIYDSEKDKTFFERMKDSGFKLLEHKG